MNVITLFLKSVIVVLTAYAAGILFPSIRMVVLAIAVFIIVLMMIGSLPLR